MENTTILFTLSAIKPFVLCIYETFVLFCLLSHTNLFIYSVSNTEKGRNLPTLLSLKIETLRMLSSFHEMLLYKCQRQLDGNVIISF